MQGGGTSDKYGPLSFSYNKKKPSNPSPGSAKRISLTSGMVRFGNDDEDDQVADDSSSSSSQEDGEDQGHWSEEEDGGGGGANKPDITPTYSILRKSIARKPIRSKGRQSSTSLYSITTISSEEGNNQKAVITKTNLENTQQASMNI